MAESLLLLSGRANAAEQTFAEASVAPFSLDLNGRLRVRTEPDYASVGELLRVSTASTNLVLIRAGATNLLELTISNLTAAAIYVKLYNKATAPTSGDVPRFTIPVAVGAAWAGEFGRFGKRFALGLGLAITGAAGASDATNVAAGAQVHGTYHF